MNDTMHESMWRMPVCEIRKGDRIQINDDFHEVVKSHQWLGNPDLETKWVIYTLKTETEWDWSTYPTYGWQDNDDYEGPQKIVPYDCRNEHHFTSWDDEIIMVNWDPQILHPETLRPIRWWAVVYEVDRGYGGPEEGGWWYDSGTVLRNVPCRDYDEAQEIANRLREMFPNTGKSSSVIYSGGDYSVRVKGSMGRDYPDSRPRYS